jgi:hypothetical protein
VNGKDHGVACLKGTTSTRLCIRGPLFGEHKLAAREIPARLRKHARPDRLRANSYAIGIGNHSDRDQRDGQTPGIVWLETQAARLWRASDI